MRAIGQDTGQSWYITATRAVVGLQSTPTQQFGGPHKAGDGVALRINRANASVRDATQRKVLEIARHAAVTVVLGDDDVRRPLPSELTELIDNASEDSSFILVASMEL